MNFLSYIWERRKGIGLILVGCFWVYVWINANSDVSEEVDVSWYDRILNYENDTSDEERSLFLRDYLATQGYGAERTELPKDWLNPSDDVIKFYAMSKFSDLEDLEVAQEYLKLMRKIGLREKEYVAMYLWNSLLAQSGDGEQVALFKENHDYFKLAGLRGLYNAALAKSGCKKGADWIGNSLYLNAKSGYLDDVATWVLTSRNCSDEAIRGLRYDQWQEHIQLFGCVLRHYQEFSDFFKRIAKKYA